MQPGPVFLSLFRLNPGCRQAFREACDPYQMHRTFAKAFCEPDGCDPFNRTKLELARPLFRCDSHERLFNVWVVSSIRPDWSRLTVHPEYHHSPPTVVAGCPVLPQRSRLRFRLLARPTRTADGRRRLLDDEHDVREWLANKSRRHGFDPVEVATERRTWLDTKHGPGVRLPCTLFEGTLQVSDAATFADTLRKGIGNGNALGFGLLSVFRHGPEIGAIGAGWVPEWPGAILKGGGQDAA
jgi:CRISPR-associated protein Cas6/Cse3/CasE subtype I-E